MRAAFAGSLDRLGIDRVDLLWLHQVVLAWLLSRDIRPMPGGSKLGQLDSALDGVAPKLSEDQLRELDAADHSAWADPYARH